MMRTVTIALLSLLLSFASSHPRTASAVNPHDWAEGIAGKDDGATRDFYNRAGRLPWRNFMGDWHDGADVAQGNEPLSSAQLSRQSSGQSVRWDLTRLVHGWRRGEHPNQGMLLRRLDGRCDFHFHSREHEDETLRPHLVLATDGGPITLAATADTYLEPSTYRCMGTADSLRVGSRNHTLLRFDLSAIPETAIVHEAVLRLHIAAVFGSGETTIGVFRCSQGHDEPASEPLPGLAASYNLDQGIDEHADVIFASTFESEDWTRDWTQTGNREVIDTVAEDRSRKFEPLVGRALRVRMAEGSNSALNAHFKFRKETGQEPEEIFFRYYLRLADDWNQTSQGGKMPGISGTYNVAGWGGRKSDGNNGWSARGTFHLTIPEGNPLAGRHPIGTYCYHADMKGTYGDHWLWQQDYRGFLESNRWYCIEQYLRLNTSGEKNGVLRAWIDGRPAFEKTDIRFRNTDQLKIEQVWMNVYHGGVKPSPYDQHLFIDHVVIAHAYIGPLGQ